MSGTTGGPDDERLVDRMRDLPRSDRRAALEALLLQQFKDALLMTDDERLGPDDNYFDLGLTSLRLTEIKQRLDTTLGCEMPNAVLFGSPTVRRLVDHVVHEALPELFAPPGEPAREQVPAARRPAEPATVRQTLIADVLDDLLRP